MIKAGGTINTNGAMKFVQAASWDGLRRAVVFFWTEVEKALNVSNPRPYTNPAPEGQPPHKRTGFLAANVIYEFDEPSQSARVGILSNAIYGLFLELGTRRMKARPWLMATLKRVFPQLQQIVGGKSS